MSAIVNSRDVTLQAADPRLLPVALPSNVIIQGLLDLADDDKLTPGKRQMYRAQWDVMSSEKAGIDAQATLFDVSPAAYDAAWLAWATYFSGAVAWVAGVPAWLTDASLSAATIDVAGAALRGVLTAHTVERAQLLAAIATKAKALADAAQESANGAATLADSKLAAGSSYILGGVVSVQDTGGIRAGTVGWDAATGLVTSGSGVVLTKAGLIGAKAGVPTFTITTAGDATFSGNVVTGGDAYFSGKSPGTANVYLGGETRSIDYSAWANAQTNASEYTVRAGFVGYASAAVSDYNIGVIGKGTGAGRGIGVVGEGAFLGGYFVSTSASGNGVEAVNTAGGVAVACFGSLRWGAYTISAPNGTSDDQFLSRDGTWRAPAITAAQIIDALGYTPAADDHTH